jgi:hypothetical protein
VRFRPLLTLPLAAIFACLAPSVHAAEPPATPTSGSSVDLDLPPPVQPIDRPPPGARVTHIVAGLSTTAISYGEATGVSFLFPEVRGSKDLRIPIAGPWMTLAQTGCPTNDPDCSVAPLVFTAIFNVVTGVTQLGGLAIAGEGLFLNTSSGARPAPRKAAGPTLRAVPMDFGKGSAGLGFVGTF